MPRESGFPEAFGYNHPRASFGKAVGSCFSCLWTAEVRCYETTHTSGARLKKIYGLLKPATRCPVDTTGAELWQKVTARVY